MLAKQHRFHARARLVHPKTRQTQVVTLKYAPNNASLSRFGFIVSKRVDQRSVVRNRLKRVMRSCVEEHLAEFPGGYDMLFIARYDEEDRQKLCDTIRAMIQSMPR